MADDFEKALIRLQALEAFYSTRSHPEEDFEIFLANEYAGCGQYDKLSKLYEKMVKNKLAHQRKLRERHQKQVALIKEAQIAQASLLPAQTGPIEENIIETEQPIEPSISVGIPSISEVAYQQELLRRKEEAEERMRRHQQAAEERSKQKVDESIKEEKLSTLEPFDKGKEKEDKGKEKEKLSTSQAQEVEIEPSVTSAHFSLSSKVYETVFKIFDNNWKITRKDIEHLFNELGHTINIATKSSHHIVNIPSGITLVNQEGQIIHMITDLSAHLGGHLSLPSWEDYVPIYMRSQIKDLLSAIGLHAENYSKGNTSEQTQFIPVASSGENTTGATSTTGVAKKKKRRKKKKNPN